MTMILTANLGGIELPLAPGFEPGSLDWLTNQVAGGRGDVPRAGRQVWPGERVLPLDIVKKAAAGEDTSDLDAWISTVNKKLASASVLVLTNSEGDAATFNTYASDPLPPRLDNLFCYGHEYIATAQIRIEPFALGPTATITSTALQTPGSVDLSSMTGEYPAPLTTTVTPTATWPEALHSVHLALCPDVDWDGFVVDAVDVAGWDDEVADAGLGVNVVRFAAGAGADAGTVDVTGFPQGPYLVLARVNVGSTGTLTLDTAYTDAVARTAYGGSEFWDWLPLGEIVLPTAKTRGAGASYLTITGSSATEESFCQRLAFLPLRWGYFCYHDEDLPSADTVSVRAEWEDVYIADVVDFTNVRGGGLRCLGGQMIVLAEVAQSVGLDRKVDLSASYRPRRNWLG